MKTQGVLLRTACAAGLLALVACSSGKEVSRGDARLRGPQEASSETASNGKAADPKAPSAKSRMPEINQRAKMFFEDANKAFDAQKKSRKFDYASLERKYQSALDADGQLAEAAYNLGVLAERQGKKEQAIGHYKDALRRKPTLKEAAENLAVMAQNTGDTQTAAGIYQDILNAYPDDASSRARLAELYRAGGDADRAIDFAREALVRDPKTLPAYKVMMRSYLDRKQLALAKLVALRAVKLDENDPELYYTTGLILMQEGDPAKARLQFKKAIEVRQDYQPAHVVLSKMALKDGNFAGAEMHLRRILQADNNNAEAHLNLAIAYRGMGQHDKSLAELDIAEKQNSELAGIYLTRGAVLHKGKNSPERGLELYRKYISMNADSTEQGVYKLIQDAEQELAKREEMKRAEEEGKRMEEAAKLQAQQDKAAKDAEKKGGPAKKDVAANKGKAGDDQDDPFANQDSDKPAPPPPAPKKAQVSAPPPPEKTVVPAKGKETRPSSNADEPGGEEPSDNL
jgi:tetratricopeptide (TPR) repeat protein